MRLKLVMRPDPDAGIFRLFRLVWRRGIVGDGVGYSAKLSFALSRRLFGFWREFGGWCLTILGFRVHLARSWGGIIP